MKKLFLSLSVVALFSVATIANNTTSISVVSIDCEHCKKDHKCDDKCKKGDKSECCDDAKAKKSEGTETTSTKAVPSCCKKGEKSCKPKTTKKETEKSENKS